jgi:hypothetical protein
MSSSEQKYIIKQNHHKLKINQHNVKVHVRRGQRTTSLSASDEGIVMDYGEDVSRKRRVSTITLISFFFFGVIKMRMNFNQRPNKPQQKKNIKNKAYIFCDKKMTE